MSPARRYAIIGTGAIGGFYGARLAAAGCDVHFLLRSDYDHVRTHGLRVESPLGDLHLHPVQAYDRADRLPPADVTVVALKATENHRLPDLLPAPTRGGGVVLMLQNGLGNEAEAARVVGPDRVLGGLCFVCSNKVGPGHVRHLDYGFVTLGAHSADGSPRGVTEAMRAVGADLERGGVEVHFADDLVLARWKKLVWNVPFNGLSVLLGATCDRLVGHPATRRLAEDLMGEVQAGARACGKRIEDEFLAHLMALTERMAPYRTSMMLDAERGRPLEVEPIFGVPLRTAEAAGARLPRLQVLYALLSFLDARLRACRSAGSG